MQAGLYARLFVPVACVLLSPAAQAAARPIAIPSGEAPKSIAEFARQADIQIIAPASELHGIRTPAINGRYEPLEALKLLLVGTGLEIATSNDQVIVLQRIEHREKRAELPRNLGAIPFAYPTVEHVVVTGLQLIGALERSSAELQTFAVGELEPATPSNIPDGLNKLPIFQGSAQPRSAGNGSIAGGINALNLRNFGAYRTLVLVDGRRVTPSNADGTVAIDILPQMLISRVDVVTGGASTVYNSDAITGVVNFILDKHFSGIKFDVSAGVSGYGDGFSFKTGIVAGTDFLGGRGHIEGSLLHAQQDGVRIFDRPYGPRVYVTTGNGTTDNPLTTTIDTRRSDSTFGGKIFCTCAANGYQFGRDGSIIPFQQGAATGTLNLQSGGDGAYSRYSSALTNTRTNTAFLYANYEISQGTHVFVQGSAAEHFGSGSWFPTKLVADPSYPSVFYKNNAFLSDAAKVLLGNDGTNTSGNTFGLGQYIDLGPNLLVGTRSVNSSFSLTAGLEYERKDGISWKGYYTHGVNRQAVNNLGNTDNQKLYAAEDAILAGDGSAQCYAALQPATAEKYSDCIAFNAFGENSITKSAYTYFTDTTWYHLTNTLDDFGISAAGPIFSTWAGQAALALRTELRLSRYDVSSNASPTDLVDCTGLRLCNSQMLRWAQNTVAPFGASSTVWEVAAQIDIPLMHESAIARQLNLNLAGRYTDYSTSGPVQTWKSSLDYRINDTILLRGTTAIDIRAPTLYDLYSPIRKTTSSFTDIHTSSSGTLFVETSGNPNLVPEVSRSFSGGVVLTPATSGELSIEVDYYRVRLKNGIALVSGQTLEVQSICEKSGGTSPYCALIVRPRPHSGTSAANFPTLTYSQSLNTALTEIQGIDFEMRWATDLAALHERWKGTFLFRLLANYQPVNESEDYPGALKTYLGPGPDWMQTWRLSKGRVTAYWRYSIADWSFGIQDRWIAGGSKVTQEDQVWKDGDVRPANYVDFDLEHNMQLNGLGIDVFLSIQNIFNAQGEAYPFRGSVGLLYPVSPDQDIMGRYFTAGLRARL